MLRGLIRELGLSDAAAAERLGIGVSTLSRWKRENPEVRLFLRQAREECRALHLMRIIETSQAANGKGWRASAWILERLFPEDYAPSATQREKFRALAERRREAEERQSQSEELEEMMTAAQASAMDAMWSDEAATSEKAPDSGEEAAGTSVSSEPAAEGRETAPASRRDAGNSTRDECSTRAEAAGAAHVASARAAEFESDSVTAARNARNASLAAYWAAQQSAVLP